MPSLLTSGVLRAAPDKPSNADSAAPVRRRTPTATLRVCGEDDIGNVVALFERVYPAHRWPSRTDCEAYFRDILFANPWAHLDLPSWIAAESGRVVGFAGIVPRPMLFRGRSMRVAVGAQFMVDPDLKYSLTGLQLAKAVLSGPQDLFVADGANAQARRMWQGIGGSVPLSHNLHWTRPLRPARQLVAAVAGTEGYRTLRLLARPVTSAVDALAARLRPNQFRSRDLNVSEIAADAGLLLSHLPDAMRGNQLQPVYDAQTLGWLLNQVALKKRHGELRMRAVLNNKREWLGSYIYYSQRDGVSEVIQLAARDGFTDVVLRRLLADAWRHGALALRGRLDPRHIDTLSNSHCWLRREDPATLVHSRDAALLTAFHSGEAFVSRMEGEWWMRFVGS